ncbi:hypothetical protein AK812_SmicGene8177 [Symbiodinium microadriaticum]|uniref:Uncharacterized protein n=1 Tax=Symbiodinium microadriaticum TaxID=2951 RepID=A0A1Q9ELM7_SYMMI|nr:hypothetical protein AK812_SmicGene8177 [Symbiodinium microadriaticum]
MVDVAVPPEIPLKILNVFTDQDGDIRVKEDNLREVLSRFRNYSRDITVQVLSTLRNELADQVGAVRDSAELARAQLAEDLHNDLATKKVLAEVEELAQGAHAKADVLGVQLKSMDGRLRQIAATVASQAQTYSGSDDLAMTAPAVMSSSTLNVEREPSETFAGISAPARGATFSPKSEAGAVNRTFSARSAAGTQAPEPARNAASKADVEALLSSQEALWKEAVAAVQEEVADLSAKQKDLEKSLQTSATSSDLEALRDLQKAADEQLSQVRLEISEELAEIQRFALQTYEDGASSMTSRLDSDKHEIEGITAFSEFALGFCFNSPEKASRIFLPRDGSPTPGWRFDDVIPVVGACGRICWSDVPKIDAHSSKSSSSPPELDEWARTARVKGTPVMDEGFICMGSKAPVCPPQAKQVPAGPITLATLQGSWLGSGGAKIFVIGTDVSINGLPLKAHKVELNDDGVVVSIGKLWQLQGWAPNGGLEFRASSTQENMESARSELWTRTAATSAEVSEKMKLLGYAGSAADPLKRGVEGCMPGTSGAEMPRGYNSKKDAEEVSLLCALVSQWREPTTFKVLPRLVIPDFTNRAQTGLGVELLHYVATSIRQRGFQKRSGRQGHDIPVLVREPAGSDSKAEALRVWRARVADEEGFPPVRVRDDEEMFTSLGNGHFFQALNLFQTEWKAINDDVHYSVGSDSLLEEALKEGVASVILRHSTPRPVRAKIAELLNAKREFQWTLNEDGTVDTGSSLENTDYCSQFEWLSKGMDAEQVNCLVRTHLGIKACFVPTFKPTGTLLRSTVAPCFLAACLCAEGQRGLEALRERTGALEALSSNEDQRLESALRATDDRLSSVEEGLRLANVQQMQEYLAQLAADIAALAQTTCQKAEGSEVARAAAQLEETSAKVAEMGLRLSSALQRVWPHLERLDDRALKLEGWSREAVKELKALRSVDSELALRLDRLADEVQEVVGSSEEKCQALERCLQAQATSAEQKDVATTELITTLEERLETLEMDLETETRRAKEKVEESIHDFSDKICAFEEAIKDKEQAVHFGARCLSCNRTFDDVVKTPGSVNLPAEKRRAQVFAEIQRALHTPRTDPETIKLLAVKVGRPTAVTAKQGSYASRNGDCLANGLEDVQLLPVRTTSLSRSVPPSRSQCSPRPPSKTSTSNVRPQSWHLREVRPRAAGHIVAVKHPLLGLAEDIGLIRR